ncbi:hypothetical protein GCM10027614_40440 [Micromonospora vulcania]
MHAADVRAEVVVDALQRLADRRLVLLAEEVLADERLRVQVLQLDVGAQLPAQVAGGIAGHVAQVAHHPQAVVDDGGQPVTEDQERQEQQRTDLPPVQVVEHPRASSRRQQQDYARRTPIGQG